MPETSPAKMEDRIRTAVLGAFDQIDLPGRRVTSYLVRELATRGTPVDRSTVDAWRRGELPQKFDAGVLLNLADLVAQGSVDALLANGRAAPQSLLAWRASVDRDLKGLKAQSVKLTKTVTDLVRRLDSTAPPTQAPTEGPRGAPEAPAAGAVG